MRIASGIIELTWKTSGSRLTTSIANIGTVQETKERTGANVTFKSGGSMAAAEDYDQIIRLIYNPTWIQISEEAAPTAADSDQIPF